MPHSDPDKQRESVRKAVRKNRAAAAVTDSSEPRVRERVIPETAEEVRVALSEAMADVIASKSDALMRARVLASLARETLRAIESGAMSTRLDEIEQRLGEIGR